MNGATGWITLACLIILGAIATWLFVGAAIDATDAIRMWRNDRRDARDVKRGVL